MPLINLQLSLKVPPQLVPHCIRAVGNVQPWEEGDCCLRYLLACQVQLLTDGCEELRICLAQRGGLVLALGLFCHCRALFVGEAGLCRSRAGT